MAGLISGVALIACSAGCASGGARLDFAALDYRSIDPPAAKFTTLRPDRCYWWQEEDGRVVIAMQHFGPSLLFGKAGDFLFQLSLDLEGLPAGRARDYVVERRELRALARLGPAHVRFTSLRGIVALYREPGDRLRGAFRLMVARDVSQILGGWGRASNVLILGEFTAVQDAARGRSIRDATESQGWEREPEEGAVIQVEPSEVFSPGAE